MHMNGRIAEMTALMELFVESVLFMCASTEDDRGQPDR